MKKDPSLIECEASEMFLVSVKYIHQDEVQKRLDFLKTLAANSSFKISKDELKRLYTMISASVVEADSALFLQWAKTCCEEQTPERQILDLD